MNRLLASLRFTITTVAIVAIAGCSLAPPQTRWPEPRELGRDFDSFRAPADFNRPNPQSTFQEPSGEITLLDAFAAALLHHPKIARYAWGVRVREAQALQAGLRPNPDVELEVEEFGGSGRASGFDSAETTLLFSQLVELGQKRQKRAHVARLGQDLAAWDYEAVRVEILADVSRAFVELLAFQQRHEMVQKNLALAQEAYDAINKRVKAGATSPLDLTKAKVVVVHEKLELHRSQRELDAARIQLAASWGSKQPAFESAKGGLDLLPLLPSVEELSNRISNNPEVARWAVEISQHQAQIEYEHSKSVPNMKVGVGIRHLNESNDVAAVFNLSIPFPVFDRNQGGIREAQYELERARQEKREVELRINTSLTRSYRRLRAMHDESGIISGELLPAAKRAYDDIHKAYTEGKLGYLEVLDAQRTLFEAQREHLEALVQFHGVAVEIESLVGAPLSKIADQENKPKDKKEGE